MDFHLVCFDILGRPCRASSLDIELDAEFVVGLLIISFRLFDLTAVEFTSGADTHEVVDDRELLA